MTVVAGPYCWMTVATGELTDFVISKADVGLR
jgi:hypothetical protein